MELVHDREELRRFFEQNIHLYLYCLGDLDEPFWNHTIWFGQRHESHLQEVALLYTALSTPILLAFTTNTSAMTSLLQKCLPLLPQKVYCHLSPGLAELFADRYKIKPYGDHLKMSLLAPEKMINFETAGTVRLTRDDETAVSRFYAISYPDNAFEPHMLDIGYTYGMFVDGELASIAGLHVYSERYGVAALGGITTNPAFRGRGLATAVTARLCQELHKHIPHIGLNVLANNAPAINVYRKLGFHPTAPYSEFMLILV